MMWNEIIAHLPAPIKGKTHSPSHIAKAIFGNVCVTHAIQKWYSCGIWSEELYCLMSRPNVAMSDDILSCNNAHSEIKVPKKGPL